MLDRSDAEGLGRDDPGSVLPQRFSDVTNAGDGAEVKLVGRRSTAWYSGADAHPVELPLTGSANGAVGEVLDGVRAGQELGDEELVTLFGARGSEVGAIAALADELRAAAVGDIVTYVKTRNINYTNLCTFKCRFCAFAKGPLSLNLRGKPYLLTYEEIAARAREAWEAGATEVCLQGGIHPTFDGDYYARVCATVREAVPDIHIHGFTALEVTEGARRLNEPLETYLQRMKEAGLRSLPGTAAEILDDAVRGDPVPGQDQHRGMARGAPDRPLVGLRSNITIMFGAVETPAPWRATSSARATSRRRPAASPSSCRCRSCTWRRRSTSRAASRRGPTFRETLLMHSVGPDRLPRPDRQHPGVVGEDRHARAAPAPPGGRQRRRRHADGREHLPRRGRVPRPGARRGRAGRNVAPFGRTLEQRTTLYGRVEIPV